MHARTSGLSVLLLVVAACGGRGGSTPMDGGGVDAGGADGGGAALDCPGIFDCASLCADGDDPCVNACIARGSADANARATDVVTCALAYGCTDETCLGASCASELAACAGTTPADGGVPMVDGGTPLPACTPLTGVPELTGPIAGLSASYGAGDPIHVSVPVDADTARVIVGVYEVGTTLYVAGTAMDVASSSSADLMLYAGVAGGATGTFYLSVELCSTSVCTTPFVRNTFQRADRTDPTLSGESYVATRENVGGAAMTTACTTTIPIQSFTIL